MGARRPLDRLGAAVPLVAVLVVAAVVAVLAGATSPGADAARAPLAAGLLVAASVATVVTLRRVLRLGLPSDLGSAGAAASLAGAALAWLGGAASIAPALLAACAFGLVAAAGPRMDDRTLGARGGSRVAAVVGLAVAAELAVLVGLLPGLADGVRSIEPALLWAAIAAAGIGMVVASTHGPAVAIGTAGIGPLALALGDGPASEVLAFAALIASQLLAVRESSPEVAAPPTSSGALPPMLDHVADAVLRFDGRLRLQAWNGVAAGLLGLDAGSAGARLEDLLGVPVGSLPSARSRDTRLEGVGGLQIAMHPDGDGVLAVVQQPPAVDEQAERLGRELRATIEELLQARRTIELQRTELERASTVDALTGVASRSAILERLEVEVAQARRYGHPVAIVLLDVDDFGEINHRVGLDQGDAILREVALRIRLRVRQADALGRSGSDGFLAILPHTDESGAETFADALRRRASQRPVNVGGDAVEVTLSAGVAVMQAGEELDVDGLLARADDGLERARAAGGNRSALDRLHGPARLEGGAPRGASAQEETAQDSGA